MDVHLLVDMVSMGFHRTIGHAKLLANTWPRMACSHKLEHIFLSLGQAVPLGQSRSSETRLILSAHESFADKPLLAFSIDKCCKLEATHSER